MIIAGLISGTSADGLDLVIAHFTSEDSTLKARILVESEGPFPDDLHADILRLLEGGDVQLPLVSSVDARLGRFSAQTVARLSAGSGITCDLIVSHGQTVRHDVENGVVTSTLQLGQPEWIAELTGAPVLSHVRGSDVAAGGQGAPLAGIIDEFLVGTPDTPTAMLNLGGIANVTILGANGPQVCFDTGPASALIDILARRLTDGAQPFDRDGQLAASGTVDAGLLADLLSDPYYAEPSPKSTGKEHFHAAYLDEYLARHPHITGSDAIATVTALTARTVADACQTYGVGKVIAAGGGTRNPELMRRLGDELGTNVALTTTYEEFGLPTGIKEALLMALIGWLTWHGLPATQPSLTGATHATIAGQLSPGRNPLKLPEPVSQRPERLRLVT